MASVVTPSDERQIVYPDTDGAPIAENTLQYDWVTKIKGGLDDLFSEDPNVFVAGDLFWYPVEGHPEIVMAPDALVVFGRPKGRRMSYMQWVEGGIPPQVVFEVLSPSNRAPEMARKLAFYDRYGVEEYYIYDPDRLKISGYLRAGGLVEIPQMAGHVSPLLKIRFEMREAGLWVLGPSGEPFLTYEEVAKDKSLLKRELERQKLRLDEEHQRAEQLRRRAELAEAELEALRRRLNPPS